MKEYMLIYQGGNPENIQSMSKEALGKIMESWGAWMASLQAKDQLVAGGSPLHFGGKRITKDRVVTDIAAMEFKELVSGYSIIKAKDFDHAVGLSLECPIFQSDIKSVEVREVHQMDQ